MTVVLHRVSAGDARLFDAVAPGVFDGPIDPARLAAHLRADGHLTLVAIDDGTVVGRRAAVRHRYPDRPDELYVSELGVAATHRRRGIGRSLLAAMLDWGRELECAQAWLCTEFDNVEASALYRGFAPVEDAAIRYYVFDLQKG